MKCPWCSGEMTDGFIISTRQVLFSEEQQGGFFFVKGKENVNLTQYNWTQPAAKAYHCKTCKRVVVDYDVHIDRKDW